MAVDPESGDTLESDDSLVLIAYHGFCALGMDVMKLAFYLRKAEARPVMEAALKVQAPGEGQQERGLNEGQFNADVERLLRERNIIPVLRVVPWSRQARKESSGLVTGFRGFVEELKTKVLSYDPRARDSEWLRTMEEKATRGINAVMDLIPEDLQKSMILTFDIWQRAQGRADAKEVFVHIDRTCMKRGPNPARGHEALALEGHHVQSFVDIWTLLWLQDYSKHRKGRLGNPGWMTMQLRGLRDSFAQILTETKHILFAVDAPPV